MVFSAGVAVSGVDFQHLFTSAWEVMCSLCWFVCLFVNRIVQKVLKILTKIPWYRGHGKTHQILVVIQVAVR